MVTTEGKDQIIPPGNLYINKRSNNHTDVIGGGGRKLEKKSEIRRNIKVHKHQKN